MTALEKIDAVIAEADAQVAAAKSPEDYPNMTPILKEMVRFLATEIDSLKTD